jgi:hypothetical protein
MRSNANSCIGNGIGIAALLNAVNIAVCGISVTRTTKTDRFDARGLLTLQKNLFSRLSAISRMHL